MILSKEHERMRKQVCKRLLQHVRSVYPGILTLLYTAIKSFIKCFTDGNLELFGSSANGFSSFKSDLDVCLTLPQFETEMVVQYLLTEWLMCL